MPDKKDGLTRDSIARAIPSLISADVALIAESGGSATVQVVPFFFAAYARVILT